MKKIMIMTDSNSGITQSEAKEMGVVVLPMPFFIDGELFLEDISLTQEEFYKKLESDAEISTSQPAPADLIDTWEKLLKEYDEIVHIPMSSGLSSSCSNAIMLAEQYEGRIQVVDNQRISVTMKSSVLDAIALRDAGYDAKAIKEKLEKDKLQSSIYITLDTLKYLKKGGRITPAAAAIGTVLNLKPVLQIQGEKLDAFAKVRGTKAAKRVMLEAMKKDLEERFGKFIESPGMRLCLAYTGDKEKAAEWYAEVQQFFQGWDIHMNPLSLSVACHIGYGAIAIACAKVIDI